jgi:hypothetical protein
MSQASRESGRDDGDGSRPEFSHDPNAQRRDVVDAATPALEKWGYGTELSAVRRRLRGVLGASLVVIAIQLLLSPGGVTGLLITLWFLLALPVAAVAACVLVLLKDPANAPNVWWNQGTLATVGLISVATMAKVGQSGPIGRAVWQLLFGGDPPAQSDYRFDSGETEIDLRAVARVRRYVWYAIVGSATVILVEQLVQRGALESVVFGRLGVEPGAAEWSILVLAAGVVGVLLGAILAVTRV